MEMVAVHVSVLVCRRVGGCHWAHLPVRRRALLRLEGRGQLEILCLGKVLSVSLKIRGVVMVTDNVDSALLLGDPALHHCFSFLSAFFKPPALQLTFTNLQKGEVR